MALRLASQHRIAQRAGVTLEVEQEVPGRSDEMPIPGALRFLE